MPDIWSARAVPVLHKCDILKPFGDVLSVRIFVSTGRRAEAHMWMGRGFLYGPSMLNVKMKFNTIFPGKIVTPDAGQCGWALQKEKVFESSWSRLVYASRPLRPVRRDRCSVCVQLLKVTVSGCAVHRRREALQDLSIRDLRVCNIVTCMRLRLGYCSVRPIWWPHGLPYSLAWAPKACGAGVPPSAPPAVAWPLPAC